MDHMDMRKIFENKSLWQPTGDAHVDSIGPDLSSCRNQTVEVPITNENLKNENGLTGVAAVNNQVNEPINVNLSTDQTNVVGSENASVSNLEQPRVTVVENGPITGSISTSVVCVDDAAKTTRFRSKKDDKIYKDLMQALKRPVSSYALLYELPPVKKPNKKSTDVPISHGIMNKFWGPNSKPKSKFKSKSKSKSKSNSKPVFKKKPEKEATVKKAPSKSFLSNVKSLTMTGMLDRVPVRYVSSSGKETDGIIKGCSYLCGCPNCNFSKEVNAYEFESHAGFKTSHPNNHIRFKNGKTIHQIVQELKRTPDDMLFDAIQTLTGILIDQKAFIYWRESFNGATRKLEPVSVKQQPNL
ncbi:hypothetical protein ABFS82_03G074400 [Erythranthe guttata]|uniref:uncharacterized protein LOC105950681 n=1 Tax=Erythranthe guttata TaxID=4155 RepID=UPI00064D9110|nr:PREDICTED: uncharacterized protein LOC105950681 [Erythranthe guttata]XP_012829502.1 PREDICTED: uncharacterized protein LOC105950681 [Erythranthe guttata]|eukprot:XP_012829501.1 PREDICTED: uncharacterized protein LOC105950681 [Erythranthe guttata]